MAFNVLIVDDSAPMRAVIKKTLKMSGFKLGDLFEAANGVEALRVLRENWLDLVLTDYNMPEMDGLELIEEMKKDEIFSQIPIVVITTEGSKEKIETFLKKGALDCIQKPFTPEVIRKRLNKILGEPEDECAGIDEGDEELDF